MHQKIKPIAIITMTTATYTTMQNLAKQAAKMRAGIVQFFYLKSSTGELRQAFGTLKDDLCPETKGDDRKPNKHLVTYYDTVAEGWRSFRMFNFVKVI